MKKEVSEKTKNAIELQNKLLEVIFLIVAMIIAFICLFIFPPTAVISVPALLLVIILNGSL